MDNKYTKECKNLFWNVKNYEHDWKLEVMLDFQDVERLESMDRSQ
jgi:hypothetical protein